MRYESDSSTGRDLLIGGGGAAAGASLTMAGQALKSAKSRASWALGIAGGLAGLLVVYSGNCQTVMNNYVSLGQQAQSLVLDASSAATATAGLSQVRSLFIQSCNQGASLAYYANPFTALFSTQPVALSAPVQLTAITSTVVTSSSNNWGPAILALGIVGAVVLT